MQSRLDGDNPARARPGMVGGAGFANPVCEMDVRPGGLWNHVMRFPNGFELHLHFVFLEVDAPRRLVWQHADHSPAKEEPPTSVTTVTLEDLGKKTRWTMVARFDSFAERERAVAMGFTGPIEASSDDLTRYLETLQETAEGLMTRGTLGDRPSVSDR